jgi:hypothetical protein
VKTTQPRRYLVRPNQGLIAPNSSETISILLVDKDKQVLLQSYDRLGQSALEHSKDKFLVQSCAVSMDFAKRYTEDKATAAGQTGDAAVQSSRELSEALTTMWNTITSGSTQPVYNKKLHVRHAVTETGTAPATTPIRPHDTTLAQMENMTPEQMFQEVSSLRRKYDELVSFSVNLTAERDILNNTLEQTKRDLNREIASRGTTDRLTPGAASSAGRKSSLLLTFVQLVMVAIVSFFAGVRSVGQPAGALTHGQSIVPHIDEGGEL